MRHRLVGSCGRSVGRTIVVMKKTTVVAVLMAAFALVACSDGDDEATPGMDTQIDTDASAAAGASTTTLPEVVDELPRSPQVNDFLEAVEFDANCTGPECSTAQADYRRYQELHDLAGEIPGDDISPYLIAISSAWDTWNDCLTAAESRFERFDCAEQSDMEQAIADLYNALRQL